MPARNIGIIILTIGPMTTTARAIDGIGRYAMTGMRMTTSPATKPGAGRPKHEPSDEDRALVANAASFGIPQSAIARRLDIDDKTLRLHYRQELDNGVFSANAQVGKNMFALCNDPDPKVRLEACKWWTARRMGWVDATKVQIAGSAEEPIQIAPILVGGVLANGVKTV